MVFRLALLVVLIYFVGLRQPELAAAAITQEAAITVLQRNSCFEAFWWGHHVRLGNMVPLTLRLDDDRAYAWTTDLSVVPGAAHWANFFGLSVRDGVTVVSESFGYNVDLMNENRSLEEKRALVFGGDAQTAQLRVPTDCTPHFAKDTPLKLEMLRRVVASFADELAQFNRTPDARIHYPQRVRIVVANFEVDYPETSVLIPVTREVFDVNLRGPTNGEYAFNQVYPNRADLSALRRQILKYGLVREVRLPVQR